jgi:hypothetical protein
MQQTVEQGGEPVAFAGELRLGPLVVVDPGLPVPGELVRKWI